MISMTKIIEIAIYFAGSAALLAGLLYVFWWSVGRIIKMLGYWKYFIKALGIASREINAAKSRKQ